MSGRGKEEFWVNRWVFSQHPFLCIWLVVVWCTNGWNASSVIETFMRGRRNLSLCSSVSLFNLNQSSVRNLLAIHLTYTACMSKLRACSCGTGKKKKTMTCQNFSNHHIPARSTPTGKDHPIYPHLTRDKPRILTSWECFSSAEDSDLQTQIVWWTFYCVKKTLIRKSKSVHVRMRWDSTLQLGVSVRE